MRLLELHLKAFGSFTDRTLTFGDKCGAVHVVYGRNEAGKTTTLRALGDLLFGFPHQSPAVFLHDERTLRVGAALESDAGATLRFFRRKGRAKTLLDAAEGVLDDGTLKPFLGSVERPFFERIFGLDHEQLRDGGEALLKDGGDAGLGLFEAGAGLAGMRKVREGIVGDADKLFRPRGQNQLINDALKKLAEVRKELKQRALSGDEWRAVRDELAGVRAQLGSVSERLQELWAERERLHRIQRNLLPLSERSALLAERTSLVGVPDLADDAPAQRQKAESSLAEAEQRLGGAEQEIVRLVTQRDAITPREAVLRQAEAIERLARQRGDIESKLTDLPKREAELRQVRTEITRLLGQAGFKAKDAEVREILPRRPEVAAIREMIREQQRLGAEHEQARKTVEGYEVELRTAEGALTRSVEPRDTAPLAAAVGEALKLGDPGKSLRAAQAEAAATSAALTQALRKLSFWTSSDVELEALPVPPDAIIDRYARAFRDEHEQKIRARGALEDARRELERAEAELTHFDAAGEIPTTEAVRSARRRRDRGFRLLRRGFIDGREDIAAEAATFAPGLPLPDAYEDSVAAADELADTLRAEAARVERHRSLVAEVARRRDLVAAQERELRGVEASATRTQEEWRALWPSLGFAPQPPDEMLKWLAQRGGVLERRAAARARQEALGELEEAHANARRSIGRALTLVGEEGAGGDEDLATLVARAQRLVERSAAERNERKSLLQTIDGLRSKLDAARQNYAYKEAQLDGWRVRWGLVANRFGRDLTVVPAEMEAILDLCDEASRKLDDADKLEHRIRRIGEDKVTFEQAVGACITAAAPEITGLGAVDAADRLTRMLESTRADAQQRAGMDKEIAHHEQIVGECRAAIARHAAKLEELCRIACCSTLDDLRAIERTWQQGREVEHRLATVERHLLAGGGGRSLQDLATEAAGANGDTLPGLIQERDEEAKRLDAEKTELARKEGELRTRFEAMSGGDQAALAAQSAQAEITKIHEGAEQWIRLTLASALLLRGIERYRERNQGPILGRASALFERLTLSSFARLVVDLGKDDEPVLLGVRPDGRSVGVEGMSDGTRDQLFFALRLAVVEQYVSRNERLPFVADDILIHFDDPRSEAALRILGDLAERTQVLYFTHHEHMVETARRALGSERLVVHTL
ncbi:AAA family ATPase [Sorangium sp. So ce1151]|uniref:AAA family ATPase n=1 Tax=Sorangium sp. So ce1151 TaxID=3133332 RepID=UPI003F5F3A31